MFAKAPLPGQVKTRLIPTLSADQAAQLHRSFIHRTLNYGQTANIGSIELWCSPNCDDPFFTDCQRQWSASLHLQQGVDLGEKMLHALVTTLHHADYAVLIGCDCPILDSHYLQQAVAALKNGVDIVVGPAEDGGYVLIGAQRCRSGSQHAHLMKRLQPLFSDIQWGSDRVMEQTRQRLKRSQLHWHELPTLWDVDRPEDLARLLKNASFQDRQHG